MKDYPPIVRDLIWTVKSAPLLVIDPRIWPEQDWYDGLFEEYQPILAEISEAPDELEKAVEAFRFGRLGFYFEALWKFFLQTHPRFELLAYDLAIREMGRTIGSFDFIVHDKSLNRTEHWEVAVKYYLGLGETQQMNNWFGPNVLDRMDLKYQKMTEQQIMLSYHPSAQPVLEQRGISVDHCRLIIKGRLFVQDPYKPLPNGANLDAPVGTWITHSEFVRNLDMMDAKWAILGRYQWLAEQYPSAMNPLSGHDLMADMRTTSPQMLAKLTDNINEVDRLFLVPDNWPKKARTARRN